jgi:hypothetical protein
MVADALGLKFADVLREIQARLPKGAAAPDIPDSDEEAFDPESYTPPGPGGGR